MLPESNEEYGNDDAPDGCVIAMLVLLAAFVGYVIVTAFGRWIV